MVEEKKQSLNKRALASMFMFFSFICLPLSGIWLHYAQTGNLTTTVHFLMSVHNMAAFIFCIATMLHLKYNWNALKKHIISKSIEYFHLKKEMIIAMVTVIAIVGLFSMHALHAH